jgi:hypothetical protein
MKLRTTSLLLGLTLCIPALAQDAKPRIAEAATASGQVTPCTFALNNNSLQTDRNCEARDIARLFLIAGKSEAALRILCNTGQAIFAFGGLSDKPEDRGMKQSIDANHKCLQSAGLEPIGK